MRSRGTTLLELLVVCAILALAAGLVLPRLGDRGPLAVADAADRLAASAAFARERAILGGRAMRLVVDVDAGRWVVGRPGRAADDVLPDASVLGRPGTLPPGVRVRDVRVGGATAGRTGRVPLDFDPAGDPLPVHIDVADERGHAATVVVPAAGARPMVRAGAAG
ncbi:MAG TPA: type II secretion system protein [Candidatus Binatia bacterium]|nr:type II secretion system protein [Candidatus Binatia bacterium]